MKRKKFVLLSLCLMVVATTLVQIQTSLPPGHIRAAEVLEVATPHAVEAYGKLPLNFEANQGQTAPDVRFLSRGQGYTLFLTSSEAVLSLRNSSEPPSDIERTLGTPTSPGGGRVLPAEPAVIRMKLVGANPEVQVTGLEELPGKSNYLIGRDPTKWRTNVPTYVKVKYEEVYPGIDIIFYGSHQQLEFDFVLAPGADAGNIKLAIQPSSRDRAMPVRLSNDGDVFLGTAGGEMRLHKPHIYQERAAEVTVSRGARQYVNGEFVIHKGNEVGFQIASYDATKPLIIDPVLSYSTYLGGRDDELVGFRIAVDASGNAYIAGETFSTDFPVSGALQDSKSGYSNAFVTKFNATGSGLVYSTYLGGSTGDGAYAVVVDSSGSAYVTGFTASSDFPTKNALQNTKSGGSCLLYACFDAFVTKLDTTGSALLYSTYLGGSNGDVALGIDLDPSGNAYIVGETNSVDFPTVKPLQETYGGGSCLSSEQPKPCRDAFITKINPAGGTVYSTFLGGSNDEEGFGIAADSSSNAYVTGFTGSSNFPIQNAIQNAKAGTACGNSGEFQSPECRDAYIIKVNPVGAVVYSTYLGGSNDDEGFAISVDSSGAAYVTGETASFNFPTVNPFQAIIGGNPDIGSSRAYYDAFIAKLNPNGSELVYSTYLGGTLGEWGNAIAVDSFGNAYVTGVTQSPDFPPVKALQPFPYSYQPRYDSFVTKLRPAGSTVAFATFLGRTSVTEGGLAFLFGAATEARALTIDSTGDIYVSGHTSARSFPMLNAFKSAMYGPGADAFITKIVEVPAGSQPAIAQGGVVNGASFAPGYPLGAGSIAAIFGYNLTDGSSCLPPSCYPTFGSDGRLNTAMTGTQVTVNGILAPILYTSPFQLGIQIPVEGTIELGTSAVVQVTVNGRASVPQRFPLLNFSPSIFSFDADGEGPGAITHADGAPISPQNPAHPGEIVIIYATGLGPVAPSVPTGALPNGLAKTVYEVYVRMGDRGSISVGPEFAGLSGCCVGLYQVNVQIPEIISGDAVPLFLDFPGIARSNTVTIAVR